MVDWVKIPLNELASEHADGDSPSYTFNSQINSPSATDFLFVLSVNDVKVCMSLLELVD